MSFKREKDDTVQDLIDHMQGTCMNSFDFSEWTEKELQEFDEALFQCAVCGWWCEAGDWNDEACEASGEDVCSECEVD